MIQYVLWSLYASFLLHAVAFFGRYINTYRLGVPQGPFSLSPNFAVEEYVLLEVDQALVQKLQGETCGWVDTVSDREKHAVQSAF